MSGDGRDLRTAVRSSCALCAKPILEGGIGSILTYGICVDCLHSHWDIPLEQISMATSEVLDKLPFGVIELDDKGTVINYNSFEAGLSGRLKENVMGKNFFREVAPCTAVKEFEGEFESLKRSKTLDRRSLNFLFKFDHGEVLVKIVMTVIPEQGKCFLLIRK